MEYYFDLLNSTQEAVAVSIECRRMSRQPPFKGLFVSRLILFSSSA